MEAPEAWEMIIFDALGAQVYEQTYFSNLAELNTGHLLPGVYRLLVKEKTRVHSFNLIKISNH